MHAPGIYKILNTLTGKFYIGSSISVRNRFYKHLSQLRLGRHRNAHLQAAFDRDGEAAFQFAVLELCERDQLLAREQHHLDTLKPEYNICAIAGNTMGYRHGPDAREKMKKTHKRTKSFLGRRHTDEARRKISEKRAGRKLSPEHVARIVEANLGNSHTAGHQLTTEHRAKVSASLLDQWDTGGRSKEAAAERARSRWADPVWKAQQAERIRAGKAAKRAAGGME